MLDLSRNESKPEEIEKPHMSRTRSVVLPDEVPAKRMYGVGLKDIDTYHTARTRVKHDKLLRQFVADTKKWLDCIDVKYSTAVLIKVCQMAEYAFASQKKSGSLKKRAVVECCKQFYDDNEVLVDTLIEDQMSKITRATWFRRIQAMLYDYFFL